MQWRVTAPDPVAYIPAPEDWRDPEDLVAFDAGRFKELDAMVRRMGAIVSVFEVRSSTLGNKSFSAFRELMDVYIEICGRELKAGKDFADSPVQPSAEDMERINAAMQRIFSAPAAPASEKKA
jgi:hypothetical protein